MDSCRDARQLTTEIPAGTKKFLPCDVGDAFSTCKLTKRAQKLCVIELNGRCFMYKGGPQGLAPMALFWNTHMQDIFYRVMATHWRSMWVSFVDDNGVHGFTDEQVTGRARILSAILRATNKPHTFGTKGEGDNTWHAKPSDSMVLAGLHYSEKGITCNNEIIEALRRTLTTYKVKTKTDAQHVIGTIQYSHIAFSWTNRAYTRYSALMRVLTTAMIASETGKRLQWPQECLEACQELHEHIANQPLASWSPRSLLTALTCFIAMTGAADLAGTCT